MSAFKMEVCERCISKGGGVQRYRFRLSGPFKRAICDSPLFLCDSCVSTMVEHWGTPRARKSIEAQARGQ